MSGMSHGRCICVTFRVHRVRDSFGRCICVTFRVHWADMSHEVHESRTLCTQNVPHMQHLQRWQRATGLRDWAWNSACMSHEVYESRTICIQNEVYESRTICIRSTCSVGRESQVGETSVEIKRHAYTGRSACVLWCVAVCCSVLQCVAVFCSVAQFGAVCCGVLKCVAACCSTLQCVAVCCSMLQSHTCHRTPHYVYVYTYI